MVTKNTKTDKLTGKKKFAKNDTSYSSIWLYNRDSDMNSEHLKDSFVNFYDKKELLSEFNPTIAKNIISFWSDAGDTVLDPFAGRTRALVSYAMNRRYVGFEVSKDVVNYMNDRFRKLNLFNDEKFNVDIINDDCYNIDDHYSFLNADLVFSCPPYWNLEKYEMCQGQLSDVSEYDIFLKMLKARILKSIFKLKPGGFVCMVVGDFRKDEDYITFHSDLIQSMKDVDDVKLHDVIAVQNIPFVTAAFYFGGHKKKRYTSKAHEYLLVWKKKGGFKQEQPEQLKNGKTHTINDMQNIAAANGGKCLSSEYVDMNTKLLWECSKGHQWWAKPTCVITRGQWCPSCNKKDSGVPKINFEDLKSIAKENGGRLLSDSSEYENIHSKLLWECKYGHRWRASINSIKYSKRWCPECCVGYRENFCRFVMEQLSNRQFSKTNPDWIVNPLTERRLELDGFNETLKLGFEYNGMQHYDVGHFNNSDLLRNQRYRDDIKIGACVRKGVDLCVFDYNMSEDEIIEKACYYLEKKGIKLTKINKNDFKSYNYNKHMRFKQKVESLGYKLLSSYKNNLSDVTLECPRGHVFDIGARSVTRNNGCPVCNGYRKYDKETINNKCLEQEFELVDKESKLNERFMVRCTHCGREFKTRHSDVFNNILRCVRCEGERKLTSFLNEHGFELISQYKQDNRKVKVQDNDGVVMTITPWHFYKKYAQNQKI